MTEQTHLPDCPSFTFLLKSHTQRKRLLEAKKALLNVYPFAVEEQNLLIVKADRKGHYDVYISKEEIKHEINIKRLSLIILLCSFAVISLVIIMRHAASKNIETVTRQKELEKQRIEKERINKEKEKKLENLKTEYDEKKKAEYEKIFPYIERIYSAMTEKSTLENISIDKNLFTVEVTTKDAIGILSKFEQSKAFSSIKMNRTNVKDEGETVTYTGEFSRFFKTADDTLSLDEKIKFYSDEISKMTERSRKMRDIQLSEYIKNIRDALHKNNCHEQYIQLRGKDKNAEVEFFILSTSKNILNFINEIQRGDDNLIDIKNLRIHNNEERNRIQTTVYFDTGIELKQDILGEQFAEYGDKNIELSEIDKIFYKVPAPKTAALKKAVIQTSRTQKITQTRPPIKFKKLTYVGLTKSNGTTLVLAKDEDMERIYKLVLTDTETLGDCCVSTGSGYRAKIRGEYYEVIR